MKEKYILCALFALTSCHLLRAQTIPPVSIGNSSGTHALAGGLMFDFSIGEIVIATASVAPAHTFTQGFLQPYYPPAEPETALLTPNNVLTPNGDGKNDVFVIPELARFPNHDLRIFDRAGRMLYQSKSYRNDWNGHFRGMLLHEDTYYYIFEPGPGYGRVRGFITIIHDK